MGIRYVGLVAGVTGGSISIRQTVHFTTHSGGLMQGRNTARLVSVTWCGGIP